MLFYLGGAVTAQAHDRVKLFDLVQVVDKLSLLALDWRAIGLATALATATLDKV